MKSWTGRLLRADLTGQGHHTLFGIYWLNWPCPVRSFLKRTPMQDFNSFSLMFYYIISTTYQKIGDLFCPVIFLDFRTVCRLIFHNLCIFNHDPYRSLKNCLSNYQSICLISIIKIVALFHLHKIFN